MVNFRKHQKTSQVINDIKRWQSEPHNLRPIASVSSVLVDSLPVLGDQLNMGDLLWDLSLKQEPQIDEAMFLLPSWYDQGPL
jgi:son of sevenless-like protein